MDAAINPGSSGGPMIMNNKVVGVSFQHRTHSQNISYAIPVMVIKHFMHDIILHKKRTHFPYLGIHFQKLENMDHKLSLGLTEDQTGVYVSRLLPLCHASEVMKPNDVILSVEGTELADDGTIPLPQCLRQENGSLTLLRRDDFKLETYSDDEELSTGERISCELLTTMKFCGSFVRLKVFRNKKEMDINLKLDLISSLVPLHLYDRVYQPSYIVFGGLVFIPLTRPFLQSYYGKHWSSKCPLHLCEFALDRFKYGMDEEVVVLSHVLAHSVNIGYESYAVRQLLRINGEEIKNIRQVMDILDDAQDEEKTNENEDKRFLRFELFQTSVIVLETSLAKKSKKEILKTHSIPSDRSKDLQDYYDKKHNLNNTYKDKDKQKTVSGIIGL